MANIGVAKFSLSLPSDTPSSVSIKPVLSSLFLLWHGSLPTCPCPLPPSQISIPAETRESSRESRDVTESERAEREREQEEREKRTKLCLLTAFELVLFESLAVVHIG